MEIQMKPREVRGFSVRGLAVLANCYHSITQGAWPVLIFFLPNHTNRIHKSKTSPPLSSPPNILSSCTVVMYLNKAFKTSQNLATITMDTHH